MTITFVQAMLNRALLHPMTWKQLEEALGKLAPLFELNSGLNGEDSPLFLNKEEQGPSDPNDSDYWDPDYYVGIQLIGEAKTLPNNSIDGLEFESFTAAVKDAAERQPDELAVLRTAKGKALAVTSVETEVSVGLTDVKPCLRLII